MRILHITEACGGGVKRHLELLAPALACLGAEQSLLAVSAEVEEDFLRTTLPQFPGGTSFHQLTSSVAHPRQFLRLLLPKRRQRPPSLNLSPLRKKFSPS